MNSRISVIIATFGDESVWGPMAEEAKSSIKRQLLQPHETILIHGKTLASARNQGAIRATGEWLCFLDADDALDLEYVSEMEKIHGDVKVPSVSWQHEGKAPEPPLMLPRCDIMRDNFIVIGAVHRRADHLRVGGFRELPSLEDWDYWIRVSKRGAARIVECRMAIYFARLRPGSRNSDWPLRNRTYHEIRRYHGVPA